MILEQVGQKLFQENDKQLLGEEKTIIVCVLCVSVNKLTICRGLIEPLTKSANS